MVDLAAPSLAWINLCGAALAGAMGLALLLARRSAAAPARRHTGGLLLLLAGAGAAVTLEHATLPGSRLGLALESLDRLLAFAAGPLLLAAVRAATGAGPLVRPLLHLAPAAAALTWGAAALAGALPTALPAPLPVEPMLLHQLAYTGAALAARRRGPRRWDVSATILAVFVALHGAQALRYAAAHAGALREIVPTALTAGAVAMAIAGILAVPGAVAPSTARAVAAPAGGRERYRKSRMEADEARRLLARLDDLFAKDRLHTDPELDLERLARAAGTAPHRLSQLLNERRGERFSDLLARLRVAEAQRLLLDPAQDVYTIEAIGRAAGFPSRSTFYAAFDRVAGTTPSRYRRAHRSANG